MYLDFKTGIRTLKQYLGRLDKVKSVMEFKDELWKYIKTDYRIWKGILILNLSKNSKYGVRTLKHDLGG